MKILRDPLHELKNQAVHYLIGSHVCIYLTITFNLMLIQIILLTLLMVFIIETIQYYFFDNKELKLADRILDLCSYQLGVVIGYIFVKGGCNVF